MLRTVPTQTPNGLSKPKFICAFYHEGSQSAFLSSSSITNCILEHSHLRWEVNKKKKVVENSFEMKITQITCEEIKIKIANTSYPFQSSQNHDYVLYLGGGGEAREGKEKKGERNKTG